MDRLRSPVAPRHLFWSGGLALLAATGLLGGCAPGVPRPIAQPPPVDVGPQAVAADPQRYGGARIRWGGTIARVANLAEETEVEVVSRPLSRGGRPREVDASTGRFVARVAGFLDPAIYAVGRELTVAGEVVGHEDGLIGEYRYRFPVVRAEAAQLWEPLPEPAPYPYRYPWWGPCCYPDPFWPGPWRGYYPGCCW